MPVDFRSEENKRNWVNKDTVPKSEKQRFVILAPETESHAAWGSRPTPDPKKYRKLLYDLQRLRGDVYREHHPVWTNAPRIFASALTPDGRHSQPADPQSWHILLQDDDDRVLGCARYRPVKGNFHDLAARHSTLARSATFGYKLRQAIEAHIKRAKADRLEYGEVGGWALSPGQRCSTAAINIALMTYVLADRLGGGMGITTATTRYQSASILRRLGGERLAGLPAYYEPKYGCIIEILGFDIRSLGDQFARKLEQLRDCLESTQVVFGSEVRRKAPVFTDLRFPYPATARSATLYAIS